MILPPLGAPWSSDILKTFQQHDRQCHCSKRWPSPREKEKKAAPIQELCFYSDKSWGCPQWYIWEPLRQTSWRGREGAVLFKMKSHRPRVVSPKLCLRDFGKSIPIRCFLYNPLPQLPHWPRLPWQSELGLWHFSGLS